MSTSMSGIKVDPSVVAKYKEIKMGKKLKYAFFKISDDGKKVIVDESIPGVEVSTSTKAEDKEEWNNMKEKLSGDQPHYVVYDFRFTKDDGSLCQKAAFFLWCDDSKCPVKKKMVYASTKDTVKKSFEGLAHDFKASDSDELDYDTIVVDVEKKK